MLNIEKYYDDLLLYKENFALQIVDNNQTIACGCPTCKCNNCYFCDDGPDSCADRIFYWLFKEVE